MSLALAFLAGGAAFAQVMIVPLTPISPTQPTTALMREGDTFIRLARTGSQELDLTFYYRTVPGTATAGGDYQAVSGSRTFPAFTSGGSISLQIYDDPRGENEESFRMIFESTDGQPLGEITVIIEASDLPEPIYNPLPAEEMRIGYGTAMTADGKFLAASPAPGGGSMLRRFLENRTLDETFQPFIGPNISDVTPFADGRTLLTTRAVPTDPYTLRRVNVDGIEDGNFEVNGWADVAKIVRAPDGRYYVLKKEIAQTDSAYTIARLLSNGALDRAFTPLPDYDVADLDVASDGTLYVVAANFQSPQRLLRLQADGTPDGRFLTSGQFRRVVTRGLSVYGVRFEIPSDDGNYVRLLATGADDTTFSPVPASRAWGFPKWDSQDRLYSLTPALPYQLANYQIRRYRTNGAPDTTYLPGSIDDLYTRATTFVGLTDTALYFNVPLDQFVASINGTPITTGGLVRISLEQPHPRLILTANYPAVNNRFLESAANLIEIARTGPNDQTLSLRFSTRSGTALEGSDFARAEVRLTFPPGITRQAIPVQVIDDNAVEPDENFFIDFATPINEPFAAAEVVLLNDDAGLAINYPAILPNGWLRVRYAHNVMEQRPPVWASFDLIEWAPYASSSDEAGTYIDINPAGPMRYFATQQFPPQATRFP